REHRGDDRRDRQRQRGARDERQEGIRLVEEAGHRSARSESKRERYLVGRVALCRSRRRDDALNRRRDDRIRGLRRPKKERRDSDERLCPPREGDQDAGRGHHARRAEEGGDRSARVRESAGRYREDGGADRDQAEIDTKAIQRDRGDLAQVHREERERDDREHRREWRDPKEDPKRARWPERSALDVRWNGSQTEGE